MKAWKVSFGALKEHLASYIDQRLENARGRQTASPESTIHDRLVVSVARRRRPAESAEGDIQDFLPSPMLVANSIEGA
jgi:hypothetical protein